VQISRAADIGLRTLVVLAGQEDKHTTVDELATALGVPARYIGKIIQRLASAGWVATTRGRGGGLRLSESGRDATAADVIQTLEKGRRSVDCGDPPCPLLEGGCRLRGLLITAEAQFMATMAGVRVADLVSAS